MSYRYRSPCVARPAHQPYVRGNRVHTWAVHPVHQGENPAEPERASAVAYSQAAKAGLLRELDSEYYRRRNRIEDLFRIRIGSRAVFIPFLTIPEWQVVDQDEDYLLDQNPPHEHSQVLFNRRIVASRLENPDEIDSPTVWNDLHACAKSITLTPSVSRISVFVGDYFQYVTVCGALEDETYAAVEKPERGTPIRDEYLSSVAQAAKCGMGAHSIGMTVAMVFRQSGVHKVLIQERSHAVSTYGGGLGVVPMFGCQTLDLSDLTAVSLTHNYLREVYEELYGGDSVERPNLRVDPRWFLAQPEMRYVVDKMATESCICGCSNLGSMR